MYQYQYITICIRTLIHKYFVCIQTQIPQCMEYLPTFPINLSQMKVNSPYIGGHDSPLKGVT